MRPHTRNTKGGQQTPKARRRQRTDPSSQSSEGSKPAQTLISDFSSPELWDGTFLLFQPLGGSPGKLTESVTWSDPWAKEKDPLRLPTRGAQRRRGRRVNGSQPSGDAVGRGTRIAASWASWQEESRRKGSLSHMRPHTVGSHKVKRPNSKAQVITLTNYEHQ